jgi:hypothetical protein
LILIHEGKYKNINIKGGTKGGLWQLGYSIFYVLTTLTTPTTFPTFSSPFFHPNRSIK